MKRTELKTTSFDASQLKSSLIEALQDTDRFGDFNYEGSAINTIVDLLVHDTSYKGFLANMLANESFIQSAQLRPNVVSHAEKLSYIPKSPTAARLTCDIEVTPADPSSAPTSVVLEPGKSFLSNVGDQTYTFTNTSSYKMSFSESRGTFLATGVDLYQGQFLTNRYIHEANQKHIIPNRNCDRSTLIVQATETNGSTVNRTYNEATSITELSETASVYFVTEDSDRRTRISFGRDVVGNEPTTDSVISLSYIATEDDHANGVESLIAASTIDNYSNISVTVTTPSYGGSEAEDIERIRFLAPKFYQTQGRALTASDYAVLLQKQFPTISAAVSWGGEVNDPPRYGSVFVSLLSENGRLLSKAIKDQMIEYVSERNVGSVTPIIVDPDFFGVDLNITFSYQRTNTNKTFNDLNIEITNIVDRYDQELFTFDQFFNQSELISRLLDVPEITSASIGETVFKQLDVLDYNDPSYLVDFNNPLEQGSILMTDFAISTGSDHKLYDEDGDLVVSYISQAGDTVTRTVGTVNYETGNVEFSINMIQEQFIVKLTAKLKNNNFFVRQNQIISVGDVTTQLMNINDRQGTTSE